MRVWLYVAVSVAAAGGVLALVFWLLGPNPWFRLTAPLATVVAVTSLIIALLFVAIPATLRSSRKQRRVAVEHAREEERVARRRFLRRLDHEIKNPVTAIRTALVSADASSPALHVAGAQAKRLSDLVTELSKLADLETRPIESVPVNLEELCREAADAASAVHTERDVRVEFTSVPWPVPPALGDPDLLVVAVFNVITNAAKYSDPGASIEIRGSEADGSVLLEISDTGWGIPAQDVDAVWDELARGTDTRVREGSGLGLSIARVIVERHGGHASLRSEPGRGTRVALRLPAAR